MPHLRILDSHGNKISVVSAYEGGSYGQRLSSWMTTSASINSLLSGSINTLRARTRQLRRNNPLVSGGTDTFVSDLIFVI